MDAVRISMFCWSSRFAVSMSNCRSIFPSLFRNGMRSPLTSCPIGTGSSSLRFDSASWANDASANPAVTASIVEPLANELMYLLQFNQKFRQIIHRDLVRSIRKRTDRIVMRLEENPVAAGRGGSPRQDRRKHAV